ncbi:MAG: hypothetical protein GTO22_00880 [Gemmatimonadales bacterium]|nr:hypothetical protein [Gemmatimonadales bacterium]
MLKLPMVIPAKRREILDRIDLGDERGIREVRDGLPMADFDVFVVSADGAFHGKAALEVKPPGVLPDVVLSLPI